jgi:predicted DsbA family dithiol-disulfide isomerase
LRHEVSVVRRLAPGLPLEVPAGKPNTAHAIACAAERLGRDRQEGMTLVRKLYQAFWVEGRDLSDEQVLAQLTGSQSQQAAREGADMAATWTRAWEATGQGGVPLIVAPNDGVLIGCVPTEEIKRFFADHA